MRLSGLLAGWLAFGCVVGSPAPVEATIWPSDHRRVGKQLEEGDVGERRAAAAMLLQLPPKLGRALARVALRDGDVQVQLYGARAAGALGIEKAGDEVVGWLQDSDVRLRVAACELIEVSPTPRSVAALARVLADSKAEVRLAAANAMGSSGMADAVAPLLGHLDDTSSAVRVAVVQALGRIADPRAVVPLVSKLQDQYSDVRREAARALGHIGDPKAATTLVLALQDKSRPVTVEALRALGKLRAKDAVTAIAALLDGIAVGGAYYAYGAVREAAMYALGQIGTPEAIKLLIKLLAAEGPVSYASGKSAAPARAALLAAGKPAEQVLLATLTGTPAPKLAAAIVMVLGQLGSDDAVAPIVQAAQRGTVALDSAMRSLAALKSKKALPFVLEHIDDTDVAVRKTVVEVAADLIEPSDRDGRVVDVVKPRLEDLSAPLGERVALCELLGRTGSPRARDLLLRHAGSKKIVLKTAVVAALGVLDAPSAAVDEALLEALGGTSAALRWAAARSLAKVGTEGTAAKLVHRLGVAAEQDRAVLGVAVSGVLSRSKDPALVAKVEAALKTAGGGLGDTLIEGLGRMPIDAAGAALARLAGAADADDRRKVAEALAGHPKQAKTLDRLLRDPDPAVRANAAWSLRRVGDAGALAPLIKTLSDSDVAVAGNAALALASVAKRHGKADEVAPKLCEALSDYRSYVRVGALSGLQLLGSTAKAGCAAGTLRRVLRQDKSWRARLAAVRLMQAGVPGRTAAEAELDARALKHCAVEDRDATVALACARPVTPPKPSPARPVLVYVVPDGKTAPTPRAPFALSLADGTMRLGVADRRGAVFEADAPDGDISLAVPAALAP